ncbi:hypothetical protein [Streptomyces zaomyceticus]|uniref:hypothetical protein n=1 Tax=Streptomyces zaomyceticus TaxID=68286 RepID=UPI003423503F
MPHPETKEPGAPALIDETHREKARDMEIGGAWSRGLRGGTHTQHATQIGTVAQTPNGPVGTGTHRLETAAGAVPDEIVSRLADTHEAESDTEHAVIARYRLAADGLGEPSQREVIRQAKSRLAEGIEQADVGEFDGHEYGGGEVFLYAYGPDAEALFAVMAPILHDIPFRPAHVILRSGSVDNPSAAEHRVDL